MSKRNNIYNEETYKLVNQSNKDLLEDYILELKSRNLSVKTIEQYSWDIKMMFVFIYENMDNKSILDLKKRDFRNFFLMMQETGKSSARINRVQSSLRNLLAFAEDDEDEYEDYQRNIMLKVKSVPKLEVRDIVFINDEQVTYLLDYLLEKKQYQKALYLSLSYDSAARRGEIWQVEKHSFLKDGVFKTNSVTGKRAKVFPLMYSKRTQDIARLYLEDRGEDSIDSLWVTGKGDNKRALGYESLYNFAVSFRTILESKYNEDIPLGSHSIRHSAAEEYTQGRHHALKNMGKTNLSINELKILLRHESIDMSNSYLKNKDDEVLDQLFGSE